MNQTHLGGHRGLRKLKSRGGRGQAGIELINGSVLTVQETIAVSIAKDVIDDTKRGTGKALRDICLLDFAKYAEHRTRGRPVTDAQVLAEIVRIQNHAIYGAG